MYLRDLITILEAPGPIGKSFYRDNVGNIGKTSRSVSSAKAWVRRISTVNEFHKLLCEISNNPCVALMLGWIPGTEDGQAFNFVPRTQYQNMAGLTERDLLPPLWIDPGTGQRYAARLKSNVIGSSWIMLDRDTTDGMPKELAELNEEQWFSAMEKLLPGLIGAGYLIVPSSSSRVVINGQRNSTNNFHVFLQIDNPDDLERIGSAMLINSFSTRAGFRRPVLSTQTGEVHSYRPWSIFDPTTFSRERLCYEGLPTIDGSGLGITERDVMVVDGGKVDTSKVLDPVGSVSGLSLVKTSDNNFYTLAEEKLSAGTMIESQLHGWISVQQYADSDLGKIRCQAFNRPESTSWNGYLNRNSDGSVFFFDNGTRMKFQFTPVHFSLPGSNHPVTQDNTSLHLSQKSVVSGFDIEPWESLSKRNFEPVPWIIVDLLPPGVSLLIGKPKFGKSWLALGLILLAVAGRPVFGREVDCKEALYLALEDSKSRLKSRVEILKQSHKLNDADIQGFSHAIEAQQLGKGLEDQLNGHMGHHPNTRLIVIDVLTRVRRPKSRDENPYEYDYNTTSAFKAITNLYPRLAIVLVHHANKHGVNGLDAVSGTHGLAGGCDNVFTLINGDSGPEIQIHARDVADESPIPLVKGTDGMWTLESRESARDKSQSDTRRVVLELIQSGCVTPRAIIEETGLPRTTVEAQLRRMTRQGLIQKTGRGVYGVVSEPLNGHLEFSQPTKAPWE